MRTCKRCGIRVEHIKSESWEIGVCPTCYPYVEPTQNFDETTVPYRFRLKSSPVDDYLDHGTVMEMKRLMEGKL